MSDPSSLTRDAGDPGRPENAWRPVEPDLSFVVPAANENRWSDLLATLIATDPRPAEALLGVEVDEVQREVVVPGEVGRRSDRLDLLLLHSGRQTAAIEVKLLSDLGPRQLTRYHPAYPKAGSYRMLHLGGLPVNVRETPAWAPLTWEDVLDAYADTHGWPQPPTRGAGSSCRPWTRRRSGTTCQPTPPASSWPYGPGSCGSPGRWKPGASSNTTWPPHRAAETGRRGCGPRRPPLGTT